MSTTNVDLLKVLVSDANVAASERQRWFGVSYAENRAKLSSAACNAVAELIAERDSLKAKLETTRCNSGHDTLPLALWDCPECHNETRRQRDAARAGVVHLVDLQSGQPVARDRAAIDAAAASAAELIAAAKQVLAFRDFRLPRDDKTEVFDRLEAALIPFETLA